MYLKSIELQGFKSFADRHTFTFDKGISAIVGPNGSGKSNIVDAIRWVLGEQSVKSLRGGKMEDVIFSGSTSRKGVGMAKVTLVLDNQDRSLAYDQDEVEIQRVLHRSGESEYKISRQPARLKDIHELFMDTGIGRDGFSVIGQGKVDEVLMQHAEDRRSLIEEAAGISKYKYRKREAQRRLDATLEDMDRLDDLLYELEGQIDPLREQAEKVARYRAYEKEERALFLADLAKNYSQQKDKWEELRVRLSHHEEDLISEKARHTHLQADHFDLLSRRDHIRRQMDEDQAALLKLVKDQQRLESQALLDKEKIRQVGLEKERLLKVQEEEKEKRARLDHKILKAEKANQDQRQAYELLQTQIEAFMASFRVLEEDFQRKKQSIEEWQNLKFQNLNDRALVNNTRSRILQSQDGFAYRREKQDRRLLDLKDQIKVLNEDIGLGVEKAKQEEEKLSLLAIGIEKKNAKIEALRTEQRKTKESYDLLVQKIQGDSGRLHTLKDLEESGEGYYAGVRAVLQAQGKSPDLGIHGTLGQILNIQEEYVTAFDIALGGTSQNILVDTDSQGAQIITWLKREGLGRVTFMPLNTVQGIKKQTPPKGKGVIGNLADLATYDPRYHHVVHRVLGRTWLVEDLATARLLAKENAYTYRLVTLEGDLLTPGGFMTGGRQKQQGHLLRRRADIRKLEKVIQTRKEDRDKLFKHMTKLDEDLLGLIHERDEDVTEEQALRLDLAGLSHLQSQREKDLARIEGDLSLEHQDRSLLAHEITEAEVKLAQLDQEEKNFSQMLSDLDGRIQQGQAALVEMENHLRNKRDDQKKNEVALAREAEKMAYEDRALQDLKEEQNQMVANLLSLTKALEENHRENGCRSQSLEATLQALEETTKTYVDQEELGLRRKDQMEDVLAEIRDLELTLKDLERAIKKIEGIIQDGRRTYDQLTMQISRYEDNLTDHYDISLEEALEEADTSLDTDQAGKRIRKLRAQKQALGDLNFTAPEDFQALQERVSFLSGQLRDLQEGKAKLEKVIQEMEATMTDKFRKTYDQVNKHFQTIFKGMFEGGQAELTLSLPHNLLETGIEIIAKPPGKKASVLSLLSGGERAMTAIALLFALQEVRPSPFVVLDEIEAALDEANIQRFTKFLGKYAEDTQFIVISHRRGTIAAAQVLYGVTMDKSGVSSQVSVRMAEEGVRM